MPSKTGQSSEILTMGDVYYKKKSSKRLIFVGIFAVLMTVATIVLGVLYGLAVSKTTSAPPDDSKTTVGPSTTGSPSDTQEEICESQECISAAARILNAMDFSVDPCQDFYQYACGVWIRDHIIPDDKSSVSPFDELDAENTKVFKRVLEADSTGDRDSVKKAKNFYSSCMNTTLIDSLGIDPVKELISEMGGWPVIDGAFDHKGITLEEMLGKFRSLFDTHAIISSSVDADDKASTANIFQLDQPSLGMPNRDYYLDENIRANTEPAYRKYMTDLMTILAGDNPNTTRIDTAVNEIIEFETNLARSMAPSSERLDNFALYRKLTLRELSDEIGEIAWITYINEVLKVTDDVTLVVNETEEIIIYATKYMKNVSAIINGRLELVQNYLVWRVLKDRTDYMSSELRATVLPYAEAAFGTTSEPARWDLCSFETNYKFPMPTCSLFVQEVFSETNKIVTEQMVEDLRAVFKEMLPGNDWMDQQTKDAAADKADKMIANMAYPDYILDEDDPKMDEEFANVVVNPETFFKSIQDLVKMDSKKLFAKLRVPVDFEEWTRPPAIVNAYYLATRNQIVFPVGILQPPFYDAGQPASMNYGAIGWVIGHEITHGFDNRGSQYDAIGNLNNWWTNFSKSNFEERGECMIDQYGNISWDQAGGEKINGKLTLEENIADNGGIRQSYEAYKKWQKANAKGDLRLPGLSNFTQDQLFFLGQAQLFCSAFTPEFALQWIKSDKHSPDPYRVLIVDQNFPEFGKAYNCVKGNSTMYPNEDDICRVW